MLAAGTDPIKSAVSSERILPRRHGDAGRPQLLIRQRAKSGALCLQRNVRHGDRHEAWLYLKLARELTRQIEPCAST